MEIVEIEWMHLDVDGSTCERCNGTGNEIRQIVARLNVECAPAGVQVNFLETKLTESEIDDSNLILINGVPLENLIPDAQVSDSGCSSCGEITGKEESCRTIVQFGSVYETIPQRLIRDAVCEVAKCC